MSSGRFGQLLDQTWSASGSLLCVGLDPEPTRIPTGVSVYEFCRDIVDATADVVCAFKPQIAYFAAHGAEAALERLCSHIRDRYRHIPLILDAKRGDIGSTAEQYAAEAFDRYGAHAVTVNPYLGTDAVEPFLRRGAAIVLCRTSNPGSGDFQSLPVEGEPLYLHVARRVASEWTEIGECGLVVGATYPDEIRQVRAVAPTIPLLIPGVGAQGGDVAAVVRAGADAIGRGMLINSSRAVIYASAGDDFAAAARAAAINTRDQITANLPR